MFRSTGESNRGRQVESRGPPAANKREAEAKNDAPVIPRGADGNQYLAIMYQNRNTFC